MLYRLPESERVCSGICRRFDNYKETANKVTYEIENTSNSFYHVDEGNYKIFLNYSNEREVTMKYEGAPPIYIITSDGNFVRQME